MKFSGTVLFLSYVPCGLRAAGAHGVGQGRLLNCVAGRKISDAGLCGRHGCAHFLGRSALVCALYLGKRTGYPKQPMPPHSLVLISSERACSG